MKKLVAIGAIVLAIILFLFGLIFLIAASTTSRLLTAFALLAIGALLLWYAIRTLRRLRVLTPDNLDTAVVDLARRLGGEVSVSQVRSEFSVDQETAQASLDRLRREGVAQLEHRGERVVYLFKGVLPAKAIRKCPYCGSEFPVRESLHTCPNCGGTLEITKT
jgi:hypothetical protein